MESRQERELSQRIVNAQTSLEGIFQWCAEGMQRNLCTEKNTDSESYFHQMHDLLMFFVSEPGIIGIQLGTQLCDKGAWCVLNIRSSIRTQLGSASGSSEQQFVEAEQSSGRRTGSEKRTGTVSRVEGTNAEWASSGLSRGHPAQIPDLFRPCT